MNSPTDKPILLFDGVCNLCNAVAQFVLRRDRKARVLFAALQSTAGQALLKEHGLSRTDMDTFVLVTRGRAFVKSRAALETLRILGWPWRALYVLRLVPRPLRDLVYDFVAKTRYSIFGRRDECMLPTPEIRARFLD